MGRLMHLGRGFWNYNFDTSDMSIEEMERVSKLHVWGDIQISAFLRKPARIIMVGDDIIDVAVNGRQPRENPKVVADYLRSLPQKTRRLPFMQ